MTRRKKSRLTAQVERFVPGPRKFFEESGLDILIP
jgi:hypothetical protein